ncbi:MAG: HTH domain-containing protein [Phycisphaerales bacterium]|nr:HTH domain-containing protein [Phycisphaerales bacterium]
MTVSTRTIYRDIAALQSLGAPIRGEAGIGYQLERGYFLPPLSYSLSGLGRLCFGSQPVKVHEYLGLIVHVRGLLPPNQPFHRDGSGGLTAAVVAGERRRCAESPMKPTVPVRARRWCR